MFIALSRDKLISLDDRSLIWSCIEPAIQISRGKNFSIKSEVYSDLTKGQRALLMIQVFLGHTSIGVAEFYSHIDYLLAKPEVWAQFDSGFKYFGDDDILLLLKEIEELYHEQKNSRDGSDYSVKLHKIDE